MRSGRFLAVVLALAGPLAAAASDAPHDASWGGVGGAVSCQSCHMAHRAPGGSLTAVAGNFNLCQSCHLNLSSFGYPWATSNQAVAGTSGKSHRWDATATNLGATAPSPNSSDPVEAAMGKRLNAGSLQCSTCHDQHKSGVWPVGGRGTQHVSLSVGVANNPLSGNVNATLTIAAPAAGATPKGYLVDVTTAGSGTTARYRISNDNGVSWWGCQAPTTYTYVAYTGANSCQAGAGVAFNDGANLTVTFGGTSLAVGDQWRFYVSYPFLRGDDTNSRLCTTCHRDRNQTWQNVEGTGPIAGTGGAITLGQTVFSHPVGQALNANGHLYDRNSAAVLASTGGAQTGAVTDLVFGSGGLVHCLSCHTPHNADSNSLSARPQ